MRVLVVVTGLLAITVLVAGQHHDYIMCNHTLDDRLLEERSMKKTFSYFKRTKEVETINVGIKNIITCVEALDQWSDDTGGYAEITAGGLNNTYVTVKVTSRFMRGFSFVIKVYGRDRWNLQESNFLEAED